jgi:hypothetical protein
MAGDMQNRVETLRPVSGVPVGSQAPSIEPTKETWWARYSNAIAAMPGTTRQVVEIDARYIAERAVPRLHDGLIDENCYSDGRVRTGIVVGSVQSGKTASMLAVAALLLDGGINILVVLAGTRVALWLQTYERLLSQLDGSTMLTAWERSGLRALLPQPEDILAVSDRVDPVTYLRGGRNKVRNALSAGRPVIFVVPKEDDHLLALGRFLGEHIASAYGTDRAEAVSLVVLDDEADDASVLDSAESDKITPKFIQQLWASSTSAPSTRHPRLFATYIAYTATPQANYLQRSHNPLAPRDFHAALRVPGDSGAEMPRSVTYTEPVGVPAFYTGGDFYYERLRGLAGDPCVSYPFPPVDPDIPDAEPNSHDYESVRWQMIGDAMRSYLVAGAIRLVESGRTFPPVGLMPISRVQLDALLPPTHSMLYHPSALKDDQFAGALDLVRWSRASSYKACSPRDEASPIEVRNFQLDVSGLLERLETEEPLWAMWLEKYRATASALSTLPGTDHSYLHSLEWETVKSALSTHIFESVKIRVLNSDPRAGDRPEFSPTFKGQDLWELPKDIFTIFVAGNVLSRGLTVEGLCTSLFLRSAKEPAADTQMQMQRWFGYRGKHFAFCKVFAFADQIELFRQYHTNDQAMKSEILSHMAERDAPFGNVLVLQGDAFKATSKVDTKKVPLHPGPTPSVRLVEPSSSTLYDVNIDVVSNLLQRKGWNYLDYPSGTRRGLILTVPIGMLDVALILESLRYSSHDPALTLELSKRWVSLQRLLGLDAPLFRPPGIAALPMAVDPSGCPYSIAAYLRLWDAALKHPNTPGLRPTDNPSMPWNLLNSRAYKDTSPRFYVGIRFGSESGTDRLSFSGTALPMMRRGYTTSRVDQIATLWGSRNPTDRWFGDQVFDYHHHNVSGAPHLLTSGAWRPRGHPGLLLIHPVIEPETMREVIAVGLAIPHGGPDHVAALRGGGDAN